MSSSIDYCFHSGFCGSRKTSIYRSRQVRFFCTAQGPADVLQAAVVDVVASNGDSALDAAMAWCEVDVP